MTCCDGKATLHDWVCSSLPALADQASATTLSGGVPAGRSPSSSTKTLALMLVPARAKMSLYLSETSSWAIDRPLK